MAVLTWLLLVLVTISAALIGSAKLRKNAFIWISYATITGWYYFRVLQKKYAGSSNKDEATSPRSCSSKRRVPTSTRIEPPHDPDLVYFESREVVERRRLEQLEHSGSSHKSDSASSVGSNCGNATPEKLKRGSFFRSRRKAAQLTTLDAAESNASAAQNRTSTTRRTYTGRKKPESWAD
ncbi:hypothetical protein PsorP6_011578 [Peronosclerospora sorghi]|uniref:Uncharacterized protein n=1 Tax=Peronosclerospora sorghi TaxID=230839 RepID=A0ACC0WKX4_9STRA|nr:hypothetical protein PsorP6_011578 [Peronosclerospora sorghi]